MEKESFLLRKSYASVFEGLDNEQAGILIKAIFVYENTGEVMEMEQSLRIAFTFIKQDLDDNRKKYAEKCIANKANGAKGGRPTKPNGFSENPTKPNGFFKNPTKPKKPDNDIDNDIDNDLNNININTKKHFAEFVTMTNDEYEKLVVAHGKDFVNQCIEVLDNYKGSNGKKYASDYRAILNWVVTAVKEKSKTPVKTSNAYVNPEQKEFENLDKFYAN